MNLHIRGVSTNFLLKIIPLIIKVYDDDDDDDGIGLFLKLSKVYIYLFFTK